MAPRDPFLGRGAPLNRLLAAAAVALALLVGGCGGGASTTAGTSTETASPPGPYLDMQHLANAFQARLQKEDPQSFIVEVICARIGPREAKCNVREDEQTKGYRVRISPDGESFTQAP